MWIGCFVENLELHLALEHNTFNQPLDSIYFYDDLKCKAVYDSRTLSKKLFASCSISREKIHSVVAPFNYIYGATLTHRTLNALSLAHVNITVHMKHNCRGTSATAARNMGANLNAVLGNGSWEDPTSFAKHCHKALVNSDVVHRAILDTMNNV